MVFTFFHYTIPLLLHKAFKQRTCLPFLGLTAMVQDLEVVLMFFMGIPWPYNRGLLHSLLGVFTIAPFLALLLTPLWIFLVKVLFRLEYNLRFNSINIPLGLLCSLSHVLIDATHHPYNPLLMPFIQGSFNKLILFNNSSKASLFMQSLFAAIMIIILILKARKSSSFKTFIESILIN
jgi:hypothetical protein